MAEKAAGPVFPPWPLVEYVACVAWKGDQKCRSMESPTEVMRITEKNDILQALHDDDDSVVVVVALENHDDDDDNDDDVDSVLSYHASPTQYRSVPCQPLTFTT